MCAHYEAVQDPQQWQQNFGLALPADPGKADVWPGYLSCFIRCPKESTLSPQAGLAREALLGSFGLVPHWAKDTAIARHTYNARSETVATKPSYRDAWRLGRRCIIPVQALYEPDWRSGKAVPTRICRADGLPMGVAGIWTGWKSPSGAILRSFSMLTIHAGAHPLMRCFHKPEDEKRMVVILEPHQFDDWLDAPVEQSWAFLQAFPAENLVAQQAVGGRPASLF